MPPAARGHVGEGQSTATLSMIPNIVAFYPQRMHAHSAGTSSPPYTQTCATPNAILSPSIALLTTGLSRKFIDGSHSTPYVTNSVLLDLASAAIMYLHRECRGGPCAMHCDEQRNLDRGSAAIAHVTGENQETASALSGFPRSQMIWPSASRI